MTAFVGRGILKQIYRKRYPWVHKGQFGKLVVIGGSQRHTGSPCFVGLAAYRAGVDLVYIAAPERAADVAARLSPSLITEPLPGKKLETGHVKTILRLIEETRATAVAIGPGLWRERETLSAILALLEKIDLPTVIDADAVRALATTKSPLKNRKTVLTPHGDEFRALSGLNKSHAELPTNIGERAAGVKRLAKRLKTVILLKGHIDVISDGEETRLNKTGSPLMTKGGMGDTLTGICGAYLARGVAPFDAACAAAYVNGLAGEIAIRRYGEGVLATDLIESIPQAINR